MIPMATNAFATEERGESTALRNHLFRDPQLVLGLGFSDYEFAHLLRVISWFVKLGLT